MKKYRVTISDEALAGVEDYLNYIADDQAAPLNAVRWWKKAIKKIFDLDQLPHRYPYAPENDFEDLTIRMVIVDRGLFLYTVDEEQAVVRVLKFRHGSQLPRPLDQ
jgi:plasmid stabilization system protein ParE